MQAIPLEFDPKNLSHLKNLVAVLEFIYNKRLDVGKYTIGVIPNSALSYIKQFKVEQKLDKEEGFSVLVIQRINQIWIEKKYKQKKYIDELHTWLTTLGYKIDSTELEKVFIGKSTIDALQKAQQEYQLTITKTVTIPLEQRLRTAYNATINKNVQEELLQVNNVERIQKIVAPLSLNDKGERVQHLQLALVWLGHKIYKSEYRTAFFGKRTRLSVIEYQKKHGLEASGKLNVSMAEYLNKQLIVSKPTLLYDKTYRVRGSVKDQNWKGVQGAIIEVYEQLLRGKSSLLAKQITAKDGSYNLIYTPPTDKSTRKTKEKFHLFVQIKNPKGALLKEQTVFNVLPTTWVNYTTDNVSYLGKSLYEENLATLTAHLSGLKIEEIEESETNQDVQYLNSCSGLGGKEIMLLSLAHRVAKNLEGIDPSIVYAFFKQELPQSLPSYLLPDELKEWAVWIDNLVKAQTIAIALLPQSVQKVALEKATSEKILPIKQYNQLSKILDRLAQIRLLHAETAPIIGKGMTLKNILEPIKLSVGEKKAIITSFGEIPTFSASFIQNLAEKKLITGKTRQQLEQEYLLFELGDKELTQTTNLRKTFNQKGYSAVVTKVSDFAKWTVKDWEKYLKNTSVKKKITTEDTSIKERSVVTEDTSVKERSSSAPNPRALYDRAVAMAPTVAVVADLGRSQKKSISTLSTISEVVDKKQWLNLMDVPLIQLAKKPDPELSKEVVEDFKIIQRVQRIATSPSTAAMLINGNIQSAQNAFRAGVSGITSVLQQGGLDAGTATATSAQVFTLAQQQVGAVLGLGTVIQLIGDNQLTTNVLPKKLPNIEELFGTTDTCACVHCRSVYSPAAYLTDLLQWLKQRGSAINKLLERRPDLEYILLNCKNATTPLPYIDLVNEVLEYAISKNSAYLKRNTTWTADVLKVQPEYQWTPVYKKFALLPNDSNFKPIASYSGFNLWQSQFHFYLEKLGINSFELVQQLGKYSSPTNKVIAETAAYFRMPSHEVFDLITSHYNYATHPATSNKVEKFLKHHELTYEQLVELLQGAYINPGNVVKITPLDSCTLSDKVLSGLTNVHYNKIWRFLRLWKYTGWQLSELDFALSHPAVGQGTLNVNTLRQLVSIHQLQQQLNASLEQCLCLFGNINNRVWYTAQNKPKVGLYQQVYLADELDPSLKALFDLSTSPTLNLRTLTGEQYNYLATALGTNISMVKKILGLPALPNMTQTGGVTVGQAATSIGLSNLYAYTFLAKSLNIGVEKIVAASQMLHAGTDIFQNITTFQRFLDDLKAWQVQETPITTVQYLLKHQQADQFLDNKRIVVWHSELYKLLEESYDSLTKDTKVDRVLLLNLLSKTGKFEDDLKLKKFLDLIEGKAAGTPSPADVSSHLSIYFDYISNVDRNTLRTAIMAVYSSTPATVVSAKVAQVTSLLKQHLHGYLNRTVVYDFLVTTLNISKDLLTWLMKQTTLQIRYPLATVFIPPANTPLSSPTSATIEAYQYVYKFATLVQTLDLNLEQVKLLERYHSTFSTIQPTKLLLNAAATPTWTLGQWRNTWSFLQLSQVYNFKLEDLFVALEKLNTSSNFGVFFKELKSLLGWEATMLTSLHTHLGWTKTEYFQSKNYKKIAQWIAWIKQSQEETTTLLGLPAILDVTPTGYLERQQLLASQVQQSLQNAISPEQWQTYKAQIQSKLRLLKRDALVAYARHYAPDGSAALLSVNELYRYYLIDPAMSSCQYTSRIKQAISSVQLFIQRCLMGLEGNINTQNEHWKQWKWMQNYRVWEANRKVFLYPENWIEPTLRGNKTELFKQFEDQLLQAEVTNENVEKNLQDYLVKLHQISNLEMKSICHGPDSSSIYVLARTKEEPAHYYYRKLDKETGTWTGWEKIEAAIKGEHPVLCFYNNRLHIFWLDILEKPQNQVLHHDLPSSGNTPKLPNYKEIKLSWIILDHSGWSPQTLSKNKLIHPWPRPDYSLHLRPRFKKEDKELWLDVYVSTSPEFNDRSFYNQFLNEHVRFTDTIFNENKAPWHSSSFVFDGFVREIKLKPIEGTYWYVGWDIDVDNPEMNTSSYQSCYIQDKNKKPFWIESVTGGRRHSTPISQGYRATVVTNYGVFELDSNNPSNIKYFNKGINDTINKTKKNNIPDFLILQEIYIDSNGVTKFKFVEVRFKSTQVTSLLELTLKQLNSYVYEGDLTSRVPKPMISLNLVASHIIKFFPSRNSSTILQLEHSNSYEYIHHSFGEEGRQIKKLTASEEQNPLWQIQNMHYKHNRLVKNKQLNNNRQYDAYRLGLCLTDATISDWEVVMAMNGNLTIAEQYQNTIYQDDFRAFYIDSSNHQRDSIYEKRTAYALYHPFTRDYIKQLASSGLEGMYDRTTQTKEGKDLKNMYTLGSNTSGKDLLLKEQTTFEHMSGYAVYNWELFFHIPLMVATELSKNQRFEEAMQWFHFIFNPMGVAPDSSPANSDISKYWITKPFFERAQQDYGNSLIQNLLTGNLSTETKNAINTWRNNPFQPHIIARMRPVAYQKAVVMKYIDNLIAWGDQLFRRETLESINQAALRYIIAAEILGDKPNTLATKEVKDKDYAVIKDTLDAFSNTDRRVQMEHVVMWRRDGRYSAIDTTPVRPVEDNYFCIPKNEKLAGYWDLVGDRLFKIRHCMNIDGVVRQLPLFAPPIDPALLVRAQANGVDLSTILNGGRLSAAHYKYRTLARLATQFCGEVKSLGQSLLSALQSKDAEGMALLQSSNTIKVLDATSTIKELQIQEAEENIKSLELSKVAAEFRKDFYENRKFMNQQEKIAEGKIRESIGLDFAGIVLEGVAKALTPIPKITVIASVTGGVATEVTDGQKLAKISEIISGILFRTSGILSKEASMAATQGSFQRRQEEWDMQAELATKDIEQIDQQITTAQLRVAIAKKDLDTHRLQIENAQSEREYLQSKYTNQQLYSWMVGQISKVYYQAYGLAFDMAKAAENSLRYELALPTTTPSMIKHGYWDSMKKGLLAGDKLMLAINKMESIYVEKNSRNLELTKHISLQQLAPEALMELKTTGSCSLEIPRWWFDLDYPGHYLRRIKALSVSIPCITGPNTTVACTLTMTQNTIYNKDNDPQNYYKVESIATSSAQNDGGVFELNFNGERFLPFEGAGVESRWTLRLPERASFDYQSITDVVLHMRYSAKDGGALMATAANQRVDSHLKRTASQNLPIVVLSLKTAFPTEWHRFLHPPTTSANHSLDFSILDKHYPYLSSLFSERTLEAAEVGVLLKEPLVPLNTSIPNPSPKAVFSPVKAKVDRKSLSDITITVDSSINKLYATQVVNLTIPSSDGGSSSVMRSTVAPWELNFGAKNTNNTAKVRKIDDVFLILKYKLS